MHTDSSKQNNVQGRLGWKGINSQRNVWQGWFWLAATTFIYIILFGWIIVKSEGIPFVFDGNETFSALIHAENIFRFGIGKSFGLTDEAYGISAAAHPFVYTHQGNFPRLFAYIIYAFGARTAEAQVVVTTATIGLMAILLAFHFFARRMCPTVAFVVCAVFMTDYVMVAQWHVVTYRVWHMFFFFAALLCIEGFGSQRWRWAVPATFITYLCLFYFEFIFAAYVAITAGIYALCLYARAFKELKTVLITQAAGAICATALLMTQDAAYLGLPVFVQDAVLTFVARNNAPDQGSFLEALHTFYQEHHIVFWYNVVDNTGARNFGGLVKSLSDYCLSIFPPSLVLALGLLFLGWTIGVIRRRCSPDGEAYATAAFSGVWATLLCALFISSPLYFSSPPYIVGHFSKEYLVSVGCLFLLMLVTARTFLISSLARHIKDWFLQFDTQVKFVLLIGFFICAFAAGKISFVVATGSQGVPLSPTRLVVLLAFPVAIAIAAVILLLFERVFVQFLHLLSRPNAVRKLAAMGIAIMIIVAALAHVVIGFQIKKVVLTALIGCMPWGMLFLWPHLLAGYAAQPQFKATSFALRLIAFLGIGIGLMALNSVAHHASYNPIIFGRYSPTVAALIVMAGYVNVLLGVLIVMPKQLASRFRKHMVATILQAAILVVVTIFAVMGSVLSHRLGAIVTLLGEAIVVGSGFVLFMLTIFCPMPAFRIDGSLLVLRRLFQSSIFTSLLFAISFFTFSYVSVAFPFADFDGYGATLGVVQGFSLALFATVVALCLLFRRVRCAPSVCIQLAVAFAFVASVVWLQRDFFNMGLLAIWRELLPHWLNAAADQVLLLTTGIAAVWLVTEDELENRVGSMQLLWVIGGALAAFFIVMLLSPGYVRTGYLERYVPMPVMFIDAAIGIGLGSLLTAIFIAFRAVIARSRTLLQRAESMGAIVVLAIVLAGVISFWGNVQVAYAGIFPPDHFAFLKKLREPPYVGKSAVVNTYAAPVANMTGQWAYMDFQLPSAEIEETPSGLSLKTDSITYSWFSDRQNNLSYRRPELFVCQLPQNFSYELLRLAGKQVPSCNGIALVKRAFSSTQYDAMTIKPMDIDPNPVAAWAVLSLDWEMPPLLQRLTTSKPSRVNLKITGQGMNRRVEVDYKILTATGVVEGDTKVTLYKSSGSCPVKVENLVPIAEGLRRKTFTLNDQAVGKIVASVVPYAGDKRGWEYFSDPVDLVTGKSCQLLPNSLAASWTGEREILMKWSHASAAYAYNVYMASAAPEAKSLWSSWQYIATLPVSYEDFPILGVKPGYQYRFKLEACNYDGCWAPATAVAALPKAELPDTR